MNVKQLTKEFCRPLLQKALQAKVSAPPPPQPQPDPWRVTFEGRYATWKEAAAAAGSCAYQASRNDYRASLETTIDGWDGYLEAHEVGLIAALMTAMAITASPQKTVVDFGGGYGVHYLTLLKTRVTPCQWEVIELSDVAELGRKKWHHHGNIRFLESLASATPQPDLVIASGVLQLLEDPRSYLRQIESLEPAFLFLDRLPLIDGDRDVCTVQKIGPAFFGVERANPLWLFSRDKFVADLTRGFDIVFRFKGFQDAAHVAFDAEALLLRRRSSSLVKG